MEDFSKMTRNECVEALRHARCDARADLRWQSKAKTKAGRIGHATNAFESQGTVVALRERLLQIDIKERDAIKRTLDVLKAKAKR